MVENQALPQISNKTKMTTAAAVVMTVTMTKTTKTTTTKLPPPPPLPYYSNRMVHLFILLTLSMTVCT
jgi:hypothetical protein